MQSPLEVTSHLYDMLAEDALRFFYVMRSGTPILDSVVPGYGRPAGHRGRPPNRGDLGVPAWTAPEAQQLYPGWRCDGTFDVSGGWYDAGDYGKYVTRGAIAVWQLTITPSSAAARTPTTGSRTTSTGRPQSSGSPPVRIAPASRWRPPRSTPQMPSTRPASISTG